MVGMRITETCWAVFKWQVKKKTWEFAASGWLIQLKVWWCTDLQTLNEASVWIPKTFISQTIILFLSKINLILSLYINKHHALKIMDGDRWKSAVSLEPRSAYSRGKAIDMLCTRVWVGFRISMFGEERNPFSWRKSKSCALVAQHVA